MAKIYRLLVYMIIVIFVCQVPASMNRKAHWSDDYIKSLQDSGVTELKNLENPDYYIKRKEFVKIVLEAQDVKIDGTFKIFSDVSKNDTYAKYISYAATSGIVLGYDDGTFRPDNYLSRQEAIVILSKTFGFSSGYNLEGKFTDEKDIMPGAKSAFSYALGKNIVTGYPDMTLKPLNNVKYSEACVMVYNAMTVHKIKPGFTVGYPRISATGKYGKIQVEISTNIACAVRYKLVEADKKPSFAPIDIKDFLLSTVQGNKQYTKNIEAEEGKIYNLYLVALTPDGSYSKIETIYNVTCVPFKDGDGTKSNPYGIYNEKQLNAVRYFPDNCFILKDDIEIDTDWEPIEDFNKIFDGNGKKITGININKNETSIGFFKKISKGTIKNLTIDANVTAKEKVGILAGEIVDANIKNCVVTGTVKALSNNAGGISGINSGSIENCLSGVYMVEAQGYAGGIAGQNYGVIKESISAAHTVYADMYAGGIAGVNSGGRIEKNLSCSINIYDEIMPNCGRVASNRKNGILLDNYAYQDMKTTAINAVNDKDNHNGEDIDWETIIDRNALCEKMQWQKSAWQGGTRQEKYLLAYPKGTTQPSLIAGVCQYAPIRISSAKELLMMAHNPDFHYLLVNNIYFNDKIKWETVQDVENTQEGFKGSLDGGGNTIFGLRNSLFGMLSDATVKNLRISNTELENERLLGAVAKINYGTIENITVDNINIKNDIDGAYVGGICANNYANIINCEIWDANIEVTGKTNVSGGICAHNEGYISDVSVKVNIKTQHDYEEGETVAGGVVGYNNYILHNAFSDATIRTKAATVYTGGICAMVSDGEVYNASSKGKIVIEKTNDNAVTAYVGGNIGLLSYSTLMNTFSTIDINVCASIVYAGGVCGYNEMSTIQNTYALNSIFTADDFVLHKKRNSYAGGVCGYNQGGIIGSCVALNNSVISHSQAGAVCGGSDVKDLLYDNFSAKDMIINNADKDLYAGTQADRQKINLEFFTKDISKGGNLGWSEEIWYCTRSYAFPLLKDVKYQESFVTR